MPELSSPTPDPADGRTSLVSSADSLRILAFAACGLLVSVKADGRFPLPESLSEAAFQALLLPYTLALCLAAVAFLWAEPLCERLGPGARRLLSTVAPLTWGLALAAIFELLAVMILRSEARKYAAFGYRPPSMELAVLGACVLVAIVWLALGRSRTGGGLLATTALAYLASQLVSISHFPPHAGRSDMLPLIAAAARRLLDGQSPYGLYELPHVVPLTYLPGTWLAFVPAVLLGFDLRWIHALCTVAAAVLIYSAAARERRALTGAVCGLFLLTPYLQYRHEIYLGPLWLAVALLAWCVARGRPVLGAVAMGWACASSQFAWLVVPVYLAHLRRTAAGRQAWSALALLSLVAAALVVPFAVWSPQALV